MIGPSLTLRLLLWSVAIPVLSAAPPAPPLPNQFCPVKTTEEAVADQFVDYQAKRVHFCCEKCKAKFEKDPAPYVANLPQFAGAAKPNTHWAYKPLARVAPPAVKNREWVRNPIDAFIL